MRIAFVCNEYPEARRGGQGVVVHDLAQALRAAGHEARIIGIYNRPPYPDGQHIRQGNFPFAWIPARRRLFCQLRNWAVTGEIDLIELPLSQGLAANWGPLPVPVVLRLHGSNVARAEALGVNPPRWHRQLEARTLARADAKVAVSQTMADYAATDTIIPNPLAVTPVPWQGHDSRDIVFAGNLQAIKGLPELLAAWPTVHARHPDLTLHLYGRGQVADMPGVLAHGHIAREDLLQRFAAARLAVFPSRFEAFGLAAAEAMACGCPVLASPVLAANLGRHDHDLFATTDIADGILTLLDSPDRCQRLGGAAAESATRFCMDQVFPANLAFWEQVIASHARIAK